jgi:hypothetical protein
MFRLSTFSLSTSNRSTLPNACVRPALLWTVNRNGQVSIKRSGQNSVQWKGALGDPRMSSKLEIHGCLVNSSTAEDQRANVFLLECDGKLDCLHVAAELHS